MGGDTPGWVRRLSMNELFRRLQRTRRRLDENEDEQVRRLYAVLAKEYSRRLEEER